MMRDPYGPFETEPVVVEGFTAQDLDGRTLEEQRAALIADCRLCDVNGYRVGGTLCDHIDHAAIAARHRGEIDAALNEIKTRKAGQNQHFGNPGVFEDTLEQAKDDQ